MHFFHQPFRQLGLHRQRLVVGFHALYRGEPFLLVVLQYRFDLAQVVAAKPDQPGECQAARGSAAGAGDFQQQAMAQYAEHGLGDQFTFIRTDALVLEKIAQRGVGGVRQRQDGAQCLDDEL